MNDIARFNFNKDNFGLTRDEMEAQYVARFKDLVFYKGLYDDTKLPGHMRAQANVVANASDAPEWNAAITDNRDFNMAFIRMEPGTKGASHNHETTELFMPIQGRMRLLWGADEDGKLELEPFDVVSVPPGIFRAYESIAETEDLIIFVLVAGHDPGPAYFSPRVIAQAKDLGIEIRNEETLMKR